MSNNNTVASAHARIERVEGDLHAIRGELGGVIKEMGSLSKAVEGVGDDLKRLFSRLDIVAERASSGDGEWRREMDHLIRELADKMDSKIESSAKAQGERHDDLRKAVDAKFSEKDKAKFAPLGIIVTVLIASLGMGAALINNMFGAADALENAKADFATAERKMLDKVSDLRDAHHQAFESLRHEFQAADLKRAEEFAALDRRRIEELSEARDAALGDLIDVNTRVVDLLEALKEGNGTAEAVRELRLRLEALTSPTPSG